MFLGRLKRISAVTFFVIVAGTVRGQEVKYPKPTDLPNPYRLVEGWPTLPKSMNGGHWGEVIRVHIAPNGNVWVFHRCFSIVPPGHATCVARGEANPPILEFDASGKLLTNFGDGLFAYPHGFDIDGDGNLWATDVNDEAEILGVPAKNSDGVLMGQEVLKLSPTGKVLMTIGKEGVSGDGPDAFDRPTGVAVAPNGDVFVADGHYPNKHHSARLVKFSKDGKFIKAWGRLGSGIGEIDEPHDICIGGSENHVYVADRRNKRIQVFDQDGNFIAAWTQFGQPSSVFVGKDDTIYVGASFSDAKDQIEARAKARASENVADYIEVTKREIRGVVIGNVKDGSLKAFIPDPADLTKMTDVGSSASGIAADDTGSTIYVADVAVHNLRKYVKVQ
ncbi:MAG TPA: peptidyl-alpha-hydroxyglycine alpha-amidating lyase family protein [Candidatus Acidoferrales bacterium]|nr:peptidyl-alpha-hydroxyglycine alpha-amidating lyase family protein [Candidatus Acidoferrales bacterium]